MPSLKNAANRNSEDFITNFGAEGIASAPLTQTVRQTISAV